jgi:tRNA(fMet)-specific endonuclease VapC
MIYMLDTNICGYIIRNKPRYIKEKLQSIEMHHTLALSSIVVSELLYGAKKKRSAKLTKVVAKFIENFVVLDYDRLCANEYATIRSDLEKNGNIIGANDLFIASHAKAIDAVLVTNNLKEFQRIKTLRLENWV